MLTCSAGATSDSARNLSAARSLAVCWMDALFCTPAFCTCAIDASTLLAAWCSLSASGFRPLPRKYISSGTSASPGAGVAAFAGRAVTLRRPAQVAAQAARETPLAERGEAGVRLPGPQQPFQRGQALGGGADALERLGALGLGDDGFFDQRGAGGCEVDGALAAAGDDGAYRHSGQLLPCARCGLPGCARGGQSRLAVTGRGLAQCGHGGRQGAGALVKVFGAGQGPMPVDALQRVYGVVERHGLALPGGGGCGRLGLRRYGWHCG